MKVMLWPDPAPVFNLNSCRSHNIMLTYDILLDDVHSFQESDYGQDVETSQASNLQSTTYVVPKHIIVWLRSVCAQIVMYKDNAVHR